MTYVSEQVMYSDAEIGRLMASGVSTISGVLSQPLRAGNDHLSRTPVTRRLKQATRAPVGPTLTAPTRPCSR